MSNTFLIYFLPPLFIFPVVSYLLYQLLSIPVGWILIPSIIISGYWYRHHWRFSHHLVNADRYNIVIVGGGMSGLCAGARLKQAGASFTIFEAGKLRIQYKNFILSLIPCINDWFIFRLRLR